MLKSFVQEVETKSRFGIHTKKCEDCYMGDQHRRWQIHGVLCLGDTRPTAVLVTKVTTIPFSFVGS
jgi:hypothetical protein